MEEITHRDYAHAKRVCKDLEIKHLGEYYDLHDQNDTLLLADVFQNFQNVYFEINEVDSAKFLPAPGLVWKAVLKKTKVKSGLLNNVDMLIVVEKGIKGGICHYIY